MWLNMFCGTLSLLTVCLFLPRTNCISNKTFISGLKQHIFLDKLIENYGSNNSVSLEQLDALLKQIFERNSSQDNHAHLVPGPDVRDVNLNKDLLFNVSSTDVSEFMEANCLSAASIFRIHGIPQNEKANRSQLHDMSPAIVFQSQNIACRTTPPETPERHSRPTAAEVWGYGFLAVTLINLCAILGIVFLPLMRKKFYQQMLLFMVALAVGTLAGSSLLVLIPEALGLQHVVGWTVDTYIWKTTMIMGGIYLFFVIERVLQLLGEVKQDHDKEEPRNCTTNNHTELESLSTAHGSVQVDARTRQDSFNMSFQVPDQVPNGHVLEDALVISSEKTREKRKIKPVAWMVIFGDGIHNFIDGLSIGAAFAGNILAGVSVSLAVICEELPHELGDFAILLNAGMSMKKALMYNFLSACMCYMGLAIGIVVGGSTSGSTWIFALAGGMFLYISLVDMLPELNHAAKVEGSGVPVTKKLKMFFLQNFGLLTGFGIILILAKFSGDIDLSSS